jgi:4-amino-4-deoxy-L-arabinose transferase-like glycosyltransferase
MSNGRWCAALFAAALLVRLLAGLGSAIFGTDSGHLLLMADWMREARLNDALSVDYHPMFPLLTAVARTFTGTTEQAGMAVSILLGAGAVLPLYAVTRKTLGRSAAVMTGALYAFSPAMIEVHSDPMTEGTFHFFLFSSMWLTDRITDQPRADRAVVLGLCAAAAYLTRPEGLLAMALALLWPLAIGVRRRDQPGARLLATLVIAAVMGMSVMPYFLWLKSNRGHWALSPRHSVISAQQAVGMEEAPPAEPGTEHSSHYYAGFLRGLFRLTLYGVLVPFMVLGAKELRAAGAWRCLYLFSWPVLYLGAILVTLRTHPFISDRYLLAPMAVLWSLAGAGLASLLGRLGGPGASPTWRAAAGAGVLMLLMVPAVKAFGLRRTECRSYPVAAARILETGPKPRIMSGPVEQVAYLCGARSVYSEGTPEGISRMVHERHVEAFVYTERDVVRRSEYIGVLRSSSELLPPEEIKGPPGTLTVYVQRAK